MTHSIAPDILDLLARTADSGLRDLALALEPGPVDRGVSWQVATDPLLIVVLTGTAGYYLRRGGRVERLERHAGEALLVWGGASVGISPRLPYLSLGVRLLAQQTYAYIVQPAGPEPGDPSAARTSPWAAADRAADDVPYTHGQHLARRSSPVGASPALRLTVEALASEPDRPGDDPWRLATVAALLRDVQRILASPPPPAVSKARRTFDRLCAEIDRDFDQPLDRPQLATRLGLHPHHITRLFAQFADETYAQYLLRVRLDHALRLLDTGRLSVKEVAALCGFGSPAYFAQCFRRRFGTPPSRVSGRL